MQKTILALDLGTSSMKIALVDIQGNILGWDSEPIHLIVTPEGGTEQSPQEWWLIFQKVCKRLLKDHLQASNNRSARYLLLNTRAKAPLRWIARAMRTGQLRAYGWICAVRPI